MKFSVIILFLSFFIINFVLVQSATLEISKFGGKPNTNIAKVCSFTFNKKSYDIVLMKKNTHLIVNHRFFLLLLQFFSITYYFHNYKALTSAWAEACASTSAVKIVIPSGTYQMTHVDVKGPCKAPIEIQLDGTIKAPQKPEDVGGDQLLRIGYVNALTISGKGVIDGQGSYAWKQNDCSKNTKCKLLGMVNKYFLSKLK